jgi:hypothetical protein
MPFGALGGEEFCRLSYASTDRLDSIHALFVHGRQRQAPH